MNKKNILFTGILPFEPQRGGVERVTDTLCKCFLNRGYQVYYLCFIEGRQKEDNSYAFPCPIAFLPTNDSISSEENRSFYHRYLSNNHIDIVINQDGLYEGSYLFCDTAANPAIVISVLHNNPIQNYNHLLASLFAKKSDTFEESIRKYIRALLWFEVKYRVHRGIKKHYKYLLNHTHAISVLSPSYLPIIEKIDKRLLSKTYPIHNPNSYPDQKQIPAKEKRVLFVGRLHRQKRIDRLLKVWKIASEISSDWTLEIVGDGEERDHLQNICHRLCIKRVHFVGFQDPIKFYQECNIICLVSDFEGFPMVLTEAMQYGCVPIAFNSFDAASDIIKDGETGVLIKPFRIKKYTAKLCDLMINEEYRNRLSLQAFEHVKQFDVETIINQWEKLFDLLDKNNKNARQY